MAAHGAVAFTDDGRGIQAGRHDAPRHGYARPVRPRGHEPLPGRGPGGDGQVNEGVASTRLGLLGWPAEGEELQIARDIALCRLTGCKLHIQHISTARGP